MANRDESLDGRTTGDEGTSGPEASLGDHVTLNSENLGNSIGDHATLGDTTAADDNFQAGMEVDDYSGRYIEERVLGKGGMGEVLLATDTRLERKVAIKRIHSEAAQSKTAIDRFLTEAKSIAALNHPNIVQVFDYGRNAQGPFLIMECVLGGSLLDECRKGPIAIDDAVTIFCQLCDGLAKAHDLNIIHRDIKPANVLMTPEGVPKLTDFGLAKADTIDTRITREGAIIGTLDFMPPEQHKGAHLTDHRSDLWSLAATFYQMVTGKSPKVINITELPLQLQPVIAKSLEHTKDDRYQSAVELKEAVQSAFALEHHTSAELEHGTCPSCGISNPTDRSFCRNPDCAVSLETNCLACDSKMPLWESVCDVCGSKQQPLVDEAIKSLQANRDNAESFLKDLRFDDAVRESEEIVNQTDPRLQIFKTWYEDFSNRLGTSRESEYSRLADQLQESIAHERAYDYIAAIRTLEQIAPQLNHVTLRGISDSRNDLLNRLNEKQSKVKQLEKEIRDGVEQNNVSGLLNPVLELYELKPNRPEILKLKNQLEQRYSGLIKKRDDAFIKATQFVQNQQYENAIAILAEVSKEVWNEQLSQIHSHATQTLNQITSLQSKIKAAIAANNHNGLLEDVELCLALRNDQSNLIALKEDLISQEAAVVAENEKIFADAKQCMHELRFHDALQILSSISQQQQTTATLGLTHLASDLAMSRQQSFELSKAAIRDGNPASAITTIDNYLHKITMAGFDDVEMRALLSKAQGKQESRSRNIQIIKYTAYTSAVLLLTAIVFFINHQIKSENIEDALQDGDFKSVLATDPDNSRAQELKNSANNASKVEALIANSEFSAALVLEPDNEKAKQGLKIQTALENGDYETVLRLDPFNSKAQAMQIEMEINEAIAMEDWDTVLQLDPDNEKAKEEVIKAALAMADWKTVLQLDSNNDLAKTSLVKEALDEGDWITVLQIDPLNKLGLEMQKAAKVKALINERNFADALKLDPDSVVARQAVENAITAAWDSGDYLAVLRIDPKHPEALAKKTTADKIDAHLNNGDFEEALKIDPQHPQALALKSDFQNKQPARQLERSLDRALFLEGYQLSVVSSSRAVIRNPIARVQKSGSGTVMEFTIQLADHDSWSGGDGYFLVIQAGTDHFKSMTLPPNINKTPGLIKKTVPQFDQYDGPYLAFVVFYEKSGNTLELLTNRYEVQLSKN